MMKIIFGFLFVLLGMVVYIVSCNSLKYWVLSSDVVIAGVVTAIFIFVGFLLILSYIVKEDKQKESI